MLVQGCGVMESTDFWRVNSKLTTKARTALTPRSPPGSNQSPADGHIRKEKKGVCPHRNRP